MPALTPKQKKYIREVGSYRDDEEIAAKLGVSVHTIKKFRSTEGIKKDNTGSNLTEADLKRLDLDLVKAKYFNDFKNDKQFTLLNEGYTQDEVDFYFQEYFQYIAEVEQQGGMLTAHEKRALDQLIQTQISLHRFANIQKELHTSLIDAADDNVRNTIVTRLEFVSREMRGLRESFNTLQKSLDVTRENRNKQKSDQKINLLTLIQELQDEKTKRGIGYWSALSEKSMETIIRSWRNDKTLSAADEKS